MKRNETHQSDRRPRVLVADDHTFFLELFDILLQPDYELVGTAPDGEVVLASAQELQPDVVVLDIDMPRLDGIGAARELRRRMPDLKIVFLTSFDDLDHVDQALDAGGDAYLIKSSAPGELRDAIRDALDGKRYMTPCLQDKLKKAPSRLTPRQCSVVQLLARGKSMKEAACTLHITPRTIAFHKYKVMEKLGLESSADLVKYAFQQGLV